MSMSRPAHSCSQSMGSSVVVVVIVVVVVAVVVVALVVVVLGVVVVGLRVVVVFSPGFGLFPQLTW